MFKANMKFYMFAGGGNGFRGVDYVRAMIKRID